MLSLLYYFPKRVMIIFACDLVNQYEDGFNDKDFKALLKVTMDKVPVECYKCQCKCKEIRRIYCL